MTVITKNWRSKTPNILVSDSFGIFSVSMKGGISMDKSDKALDVMPRKLTSMMAKLKRLLDDKKKDEVPAYDYRYDVAELRLDIAWELFEMGRYQ